MLLTSSRDNWERLVTAVVKKQQIWELCHQQSRSPSITTISSSDDLSERTLSTSDPFSVHPSPRFPPEVLSFSQVSNNASSRPFARMLFSAWYRIRKSKDKDLVDIPAEEDPALKRFSLRELQVATDKFSNKNIMWRCGFWKVYKGRLADGSLVSVKRLREEQTPDRELLFQTEVEISSMAVHRNLCRLCGFCITRTERLLVYPYMDNGHVASFLRDRPPNVPPLDWGTRKRIALGSARGLSYLHDHCDQKIIHRDVKAANILLDDEYEAVVGDFSLAKLMDHNDTHVTTVVCGTIEHIAPEYLSTGEMSEKTDVYAYGITLLELITGQRAFDLGCFANDDNLMLLDWVTWLLREKKLETLVDPDLQKNFVEAEVEQLIQVALLCSQTSSMYRPKMSEVVRMLEGNIKWDEWKMVEEFRGEVKLAPRLSFAEYTEVYLGQLERFSLHQLQVATDMFSDRNLLGKGGYGMVYLGRLIDGTLVAIKRLKMKRTTDGELSFHTEIQIFCSMAVHSNLLRLRGFCMTFEERLLVYPYLVNGSVASCLRDRPQNAPPLGWWTRKRIALGCARGLSSLHDQCDRKIIHGDVKAANIFLDDEYEAVVGDFSLAKLMDHNDTDVTAAACGTLGHIAPEYLYTGQMSGKTDVFAYGVMLLELITGQRSFDLVRFANDDDAMLLDWVKRLLEENKLKSLVDPDLPKTYVVEEVEKLVQVALLCTRRSVLGRPKMSEVVVMLESDGLAEKWD